jgi:dUTP pyrophosphatase
VKKKTVQLKIKKLDPKAVIPVRAKPGDAGMDITVISGPTFVSDNEEGYHYVEYGTGLAMEIPEGYGIFGFPRSSASKTALSQANAVAVIDSGYRGEVKLRFKIDALMMMAIERGDAKKLAQYKPGDKACQIVVLELPKVEVLEVEELSSTERGEGGFGSTGK